MAAGSGLGTRLVVPYCIKCGNLVWFWDVTGTRPHEERVNIGFSRKMVATSVLAFSLSKAKSIKRKPFPEEERISGKSILALKACFMLYIL